MFQYLSRYIAASRESPKRPSVGASAKLVLTGEQAPTERVVDHGGEAGDGRVLGVFVFDTSCEQVVELLGDDGPGSADPFGDVDDFADLPGREVGDPEVADLAFGHQIGDGASAYLPAVAARSGWCR